MSTNAAQPEPVSDHADNAAVVPRGYKRTEAGVIPDDWEVAAISELFDASAGGDFDISRSQPLRDEQHPYPIYSNALADYGLYGYCSYSDHPAGSITVTARGTLGVANFRDHQYTAIGRVLVLRPKTDLDGRFFAEFINNRISFVIESTGVPQLTAPQISKYNLPVPPIPEQHAIAAALSDVGGLIGALDKLIAKKRAIKQAAMQQLLTGKTRLPGFEDGPGCKQTEVGAIPVDWQLKPLRIISSMNGRIGWQGLKQSEFTFNPDDPFLITGMNFRDGGIDWDEAYHVPEERYAVAPQIQLRRGDVLMTKDGTIGKLLYVRDIPYPGTATLNSHLLVFRPIANSFVPLFLFYQLSSRRFADHVELSKSGSTFFGISQHATGNFNTILPPILEQEAIAAALSDMDTEISALERRRDKIKAIKQGMMQVLLTGRVRLVKPVANA
jgi:type I restriction enzyme S subunit